MHTRRHTPDRSPPPPFRELAARQARCFLLGVHNLSQALIESRVIYNSAAPLPEWAAPSYCSPGQSLRPPLPHPPHTGSHTQALKREKGTFPSLPPAPFFILAFLQGQRLGAESFCLNPLTTIKPNTTQLSLPETSHSLSNLPV